MVVLQREDEWHEDYGPVLWLQIHPDDGVTDSRVDCLLGSWEPEDDSFGEWFWMELDNAAIGHAIERIRFDNKNGATNDTP